MSVRAYRVNKIDTEDSASFNLWHDDEIVERLGIYQDLGEEGCGIGEVEVERLKNLLDDKTVKLEPETRQALQTDYEWAVKNNHEWIQYDCF